MSVVLQPNGFGRVPPKRTSPPLVVAHRGGAGLRPENTLAAFAFALELGADGVEVDVHLTKDGAPVVHHDDRLRPDATRTPDGAWLEGPGPKIADLTVGEIKRYDVGRLNPGAPYAGLYPERLSVDGETIPTLEEALVLLRDRSASAICLVEIKTPFAEAPFAHADLVDAVLRVLDKTGMASRGRLMAFDWRALDHARRAAPDLPRGHTTIPGEWLAGRTPPEHALLPQATRDALAARAAAGPAFMRGYAASRWTTELIDLIAEDKSGFWTANHYDVTPELVSYAAGRGVEVFPWTVDAPDAIERMYSAGVDGLITDYPDRAIERRR